MCAGEGSRKEGELMRRGGGSMSKVLDGSQCAGVVGGKEKAKGVIVLLDLKQVKRKRA